MEVAIIALLIPIVALLAGAYTKVEKMKLEKHKSSSPAELNQFADEIKRLQSENEDLKQRLSNIETIVTSEGWEKLPPKDLDINLHKQIEEMAQELKKLKKGD